MQLVGKLAVAALNDVRKDTPPRTNWRAVNAGGLARLVSRSVALLTALGSIAAMSIMGLVSMGGYGAALILGKIRPLRDAYQFLSRTYDRFLVRLGQEVLRDSRDTPALRLMVSLSLTALPIF